jgi:hypothetical protein
MSPMPMGVLGTLSLLSCVLAFRWGYEIGVVTEMNWLAIAVSGTLTLLLSHLAFRWGYEIGISAEMTETARWKQRALRCVFCGYQAESLRQLQDHSAGCARHPAILKEQDRTA